MELFEERGILRDIYIEVVSDDQERTLEYLKNGRVSACVSTSEKEVTGGRVHFLGNMEYLLVASPSFANEHFSKGNPKKCLASAPALKFDENDHLHERYLEKFFHLDGREVNYEIIPSVKGFKKLAFLGYGYGLIPKIDIIDELKRKQLIQLYPDKTWKIPLYWHYWAVESKLYQKFNQEIIQRVSNKLK